MNNDDDDDKKKLNLLLVNLKSISRVQPYDKLQIIDNIYIIKDERFLQFIQRWLNGDNRKYVLTFIENLIIQCQDFILNEKLIMNDRVKLIRILSGFIIGLENLKITYQEDQITIFILENYIDDIHKLIEM